MRYMHLAPSEKNRAIDLLNAARTPEGNPAAEQNNEVSPRGFEFVGDSTHGNTDTSSEAAIAPGAEVTPRDASDSLTVLSQELDIANWGEK